MNSMDYPAKEFQLCNARISASDMTNSTDSLQLVERKQTTLRSRRMPCPVSRNRKRRVFSCLSLCGLIMFPFLVCACPLYNPASFVQPPAAKNLLMASKQVTLVWDAPPAGSPSIVKYIISYRVHGTSAWTTLATIPATAQPSYVVSYAAIGPGSFDFAVAAVTNTGAVSAVHTSLDDTAVPPSGWFLTWN
jgi:hypothetical protein